MVFPEDTRKAIYEANGRPIVIPWPEGGPPKPYRTYAVQSKLFCARTTSIEVVAVYDKHGAGCEVKVNVPTERYPLKINAYVPAGPNPLDGSQEAPEYEPDQIDPAYQRQIAREATVTLDVQRMRQKAQTRERRAKGRVAKERKNGGPGKLAEASLARAQAAAERAA